MREAIGGFGRMRESTKIFRTGTMNISNSYFSNFSMVTIVLRNIIPFDKTKPCVSVMGSADITLTGPTQSLFINSLIAHLQREIDRLVAEAAKMSDPQPR